MYIDPMSVLEWLRHITGLHIHEARQTGDEKTWEQILRELNPISSSFIRRINVLIEFDQQIRSVFSLPSPIANQTILARIFAFSSGCPLL
jgi:hypothetical protein